MASAAAGQLRPGRQRAAPRSSRPSKGRAPRTARRGGPGRRARRSRRGSRHARRGRRRSRRRCRRGLESRAPRRRSRAARSASPRKRFSRPRRTRQNPGASTSSSRAGRRQSVYAIETPSDARARRWRVSGAVDFSRGARHRGSPSRRHSTTAPAREAAAAGRQAEERVGPGVRREVVAPERLERRDAELAVEVLEDAVAIGLPRSANGDVLRQARRHEARARPRDALERVERRGAEEVEGDRGRNRVAGKAQPERAAAPAEHDGFSGPHRDAVEEELEAGFLRGRRAGGRDRRRRRRRS